MDLGSTHTRQHTNEAAPHRPGRDTDLFAMPGAQLAAVGTPIVERSLIMFRQLRQLLVLATAGLCLAAVTAGAGSAQPRYDALYDALRVQPSAVRAAANATSLDTAVRFGRQAIYDPYLDALRIRPRSLERILAIGSRRGRATVPQPCRRCQ